MCGWAFRRGRHLRCIMWIEQIAPANPRIQLQLTRRIYKENGRFVHSFGVCPQVWCGVGFVWVVVLFGVVMVSS